MKKLKLLIFAIICLIAIPRVNALSVTTKITGSNSIKVGNTTTLYVKINSSSPIRGADITYSASGAISIVSVTPAGGMTKQDQRGNRILLYSSKSLSSGTSVLAIKIKGNKVGTGTLTISKLEASVGKGSDLKTATGNKATFKVTVNPKKTEAEIAAEKEAAEKAKEAAEKAKEEAAKARAEAEKKAKEQAEKDKKDLEKATALVEAAERSNLKDDYEAALKAVNALKDSTDKTKLLERLEEVRFNIAVKEACKPCEETKCETKEVSSGGTNKWLILNIILLAVVIGEFIYILVSRKNREN